MSLHLYLGEAGSGKTTSLIEEIVEHALAHPDMTHLLLVPEQFCLSTQLRLVERHPRHSLLNIEALSFDRLAARAFREFSAVPQKILKDDTKRMLLALAVRDCRSRLNVYARQAGRPAFTARLASLFAEWDMNDVSPERLSEIAGQVPGQLERKLTDLIVIYRAYKERLAGRDQMAAEEVLPSFLRLLPKSRVGRADRLYLDGFTGLTRVQYDILTLLMRRCEETAFTLTLPEREDPDAAPGDGLFSLSLDSLRHLTGCAERAGQKWDIRYIRSAPQKQQELAWLGRHFLQDAPKKAWGEPPKSIRLYACESPQAEADFAVRQIAALTEGENALHYRDIALVVGDPEKSIPLLRKKLEAAGIPYFTDRREALASHPLVRLLQDALEAVRTSFRREAVLQIAKNPYSPLQPEEADRLENYLLAVGARRGKALTEAFHKNRPPRRGEKKALYEAVVEEEMTRLEEVRRRLMEPLVLLKNEIGLKPFASDGAAALGHFLNTLGASDKAAMRREEKVLTQIDALLGGMRDIMGGCPMRFQEFAETVSAGLEALSAGKLPPSADEILIGDLERSRFGNIRSLIFLNLNEGILPKKKRDGRLINDKERIILARFAEELGYTDEKALKEERFYLYSLLQKPVESLYLSFSLTGGAGSDEKEKLPSFFVKEILNLFPKLPILRFHEEEWALTGVRDAAERLSRHFSEEGENSPLYRLLKDTAEGAEEEEARSCAQKALEMIRCGALARFEGISLEPELALRLYGPVLHGSVTSLERFAACPFAYFLEQGLGLSERSELSWEANDHGSFFHKVLEVMLRRIKREKADLSLLSPEQKQALIDEAVSKAEKQAEKSAWEDKADREYLLGRWKRFFGNYLDYLAGALPGDLYVPDAFELSFGQGQESRSFTRIGLDRGSLELAGVIDRLDLCQKPEGLYLRIVDYKTGTSTRFEPVRIASGLQLQLALYLNIALKIYAEKYPEEKIYAGGLYYAYLTEFLVDWRKDEAEIRAALDKELAPRGITALETAPPEAFGKNGQPKKNGPPFASRARLALLADFARDKIRSMGNEILSGRADPSPCRIGQDAESSSCRYCRFKESCPFDERTAGFSHREIRIKKEEAWEIIAGKEAENGDIQS